VAARIIPYFQRPVTFNEVRGLLNIEDSGKSFALPQ